MNIFLDVDETLVRSHEFDTPNKKAWPHAETLAYDPCISTGARPCARRVIEFARELVGGHDKVFLLSIGMQEYIEALNTHFGWGFDPVNIYGREIIEQHTRTIVAAYGDTYSEVDPIIFAHPSNVLIDNLPRRANKIKIDFIGIGKTHDTNYLCVRDYYGSLNETQDKLFYNQVTTFLQERYESSQAQR